METLNKKQDTNKRGFPLLAILCLICISLLCACTAQTKPAYQLLSGFFSWKQKNFQDAAVQFLTLTEEAKEKGDISSVQYGTYALATTYLAQNESEAALARFAEITQDAPKEILFSSVYNTGIIAYKNRQYEQAAALFKKALLIDSSNIDAKINLELSIDSHTISQAKQASSAQAVHKSQEESQSENALFSIIRAKENQNWKNPDTNQEKQKGIDY